MNLIFLIRIEEANDAVELILSLLDYMEDKIVEPEKFRMVFTTLTLTFKGLKLSEIMEIVS